LSAAAIPGIKLRGAAPGAEMREEPMKTLAIIAMLALLGAPAVAAAADDPVAGAWKVNGHVDGKDFVVTCRFERHGEGVGGACFDGGTNLKHPLISGAVAGDQVKWTYQSHWTLVKFDVLYAGKVAGGAMRGTVGAAGHNGTFTATKE
jgi:hypothetical protein